MSAGILPALKGIMQALNDAGVSCVADPADLNPPAVLAAVGDIHPSLLNGDGSVDVRLNLCVPNTAWEDALAALDSLLADVSEVVDLNDPIFGETLIVSGAELPSYRATASIYYERTV